MFNGLYSSITKSLQKLKSDADRIANGDLTHQVELETKDEMQELAIKQAINIINEMNSQSSRSTEEQRKAANAIATGIDRGRKLADNVLSDAEHTALVGNNLAKMAADLRQQVAVFKL